MATGIIFNTSDYFLVSFTGFCSVLTMSSLCVYVYSNIERARHNKSLCIYTDNVYYTLSFKNIERKIQRYSILFLSPYIWVGCMCLNKNTHTSVHAHTQKEVERQTEHRKLTAYELPTALLVTKITQMLLRMAICPTEKNNICSISCKQEWLCI